RKLCKAQQTAASGDRDPAQRNRGSLGARGRRRFEPVDQGRGQAGAAWRTQSRATSRDGVRLHGRRARRASGREKDPQPRQAPEEEDAAQILFEQEIEGDPARARKQKRGGRRRASGTRREDSQDPPVEGSAEPGERRAQETA